jgi:hypothetical protein
MPITFLLFSAVSEPVSTALLPCLRLMGSFTFVSHININHFHANQPFRFPAAPKRPSKKQATVNSRLLRPFTSNHRIATITQMIDHQ